jgi:glycosyltransferase involved in cell wall biosynthesis
MKLIIQIPCLNEVETLPAVLAQLPTAIAGVSCIETLVIDDGSSDNTAVVARQLGVTHVVRHAQTKGLARTFQTGLETALRLGADIIVNTDGDNQYPATAIPALVAPIVRGEADMVIGDRGVHASPHFSPLKRQFQRLGNWVVRNVSNTAVRDAVSGFRAYSRETALRLTILTNFSYTLDTLIQAGKMGLIIVSIPIEANAPTRPSRLQKNMAHFIKAQASTILRLYVFYEPLKTFSYIALPFFLLGTALLARFFWVYWQGNGSRFVQSVSIGIGLLVVGVLIFLVGVQADVASKHRQLSQEVLYRLRKLELNRDDPPPP